MHFSRTHRRAWLAQTACGAAALASGPLALLSQEQPSPKRQADRLRITGLKVTPIALPDPPILAASGCHGPYFLRNIIELETNAGITGIGETHGGESVTAALEESRSLLLNESPFAYRKFQTALSKTSNSVYAGIELACLDAIGRFTGRRLCELLGGPVRESVEFASYLFFRFASDHPRVLDDARLVDKRGRGDQALDAWGEVRTPETMAEMAWKFHRKWGFKIHKLKAGVLPPEIEVEALKAISQRFSGQHPVRIDPNGRWTVETAVRMARRMDGLPLDYYEDPVRGQEGMAEVRRQTGLTMSTNMCVTRFHHVPQALELKPIDVVLCDHHGWGGIPACQALGTIAETVGWGLSQHSNNHAGITMAAMIHVGAVIPHLQFASDTHYPWLVEGADIIDGANLPVENGQMRVPPAPGVGVNLDRAKLARAHETYLKCGMRQRDDATTMRRIEPGWERTLF